MVKGIGTIIYCEQKSAGRFSYTSALLAFFQYMYMSNINCRRKLEKKYGYLAY